MRFLKRLGIEPTVEIPVANLRKMVAGDAGHEKLQQLLNKQGKLFASENTLGDDNVKGHFDGIVKDGDTKALVEFKTIEKYQMPYIAQDGPKPQHLMQMFTYWLWLRNDYKDLDQAILVYVKREDFEARTYDYKWDEDIAIQTLEHWALLSQYWTKQELPPCTCDKDYGGNGQKYCRYRLDGKCCNEALFKQEITV